MDQLSCMNIYVILIGHNLRNIIYKVRALDQIMTKVPFKQLLKMRHAASPRPWRMALSSFYFLQASE